MRHSTFLSVFLVIAAWVTPASDITAQCLIQNLEQGVPQGDLVSASGGFVSTTNADGSLLTTYVTGPDGYEVTNVYEAPSGESVVAIDAFGPHVAFILDTGTTYELMVVDGSSGGTGFVGFSAAPTSGSPAIALNFVGSGYTVAAAADDGQGGFEVVLYESTSFDPIGPYIALGPLPSILPASHSIGGLELDTGSFTSATLAVVRWGSFPLVSRLELFHYDGTGWTSAGTLPAGRSPGGAVDVYGDDVIFASGVLGSNALGSVVRWNDTAATYIEVFSFAGEGAGLGSSVAIYGEFAAAAGPDGVQLFQRDSTTSTNWSDAGVLPLPTSGGLAPTDLSIYFDEVYVSNPTAFGGSGAVHVYDVDRSVVVTDLGGALAGTNGIEPVLLSQTDICRSAGNMSIALTSMRPFSTYSLVIGFAETNTPFKGGTLVPSPTLLLSGLPTGLGSQGFNEQLPFAGVGNLDLILQAWIVDGGGPKGLSATNALRFSFTDD